MLSMSCIFIFLEQTHLFTLVVGINQIPPSQYFYQNHYFEQFTSPTNLKFIPRSENVATFLAFLFKAVIQLSITTQVTTKDKWEVWLVLLILLCDVIKADRFLWEAILQITPLHHLTRIDEQKQCSNVTMPFRVLFPLIIGGL